MRLGPILQLYRSTDPTATIVGPDRRILAVFRQMRGNRVSAPGEPQRMFVRAGEADRAGRWRRSRSHLFRASEGGTLVNAVDPRIRRLGTCLLAVWLAGGTAGRVLAQLTTPEERIQILMEPDALSEALKQKAKREKDRPPFEFFRSQVAPFDVLPYVKANHWSTLSFEMRANDDDYDGYLQTDPVMLIGMPVQVFYRRDARLLKEQHTRRSLQMMIPATNGQIPKEWSAALLRPGALRSDVSWMSSLATLPPHQMLVLVLSKDATAKFAAWNRMAATIPASAEREGGDTEKVRYYRLVLPLDPDKPPISSHPLTWSTTSHVIWDGYSPESLSVSQQEAMLDWIHWGGQLIVSGGAGQPYPLYREGFLGPYLPADATGDTVALLYDDLQPLSQSYPPPTYRPNSDEQSQPAAINTMEAARRLARIIRRRLRFGRRRAARFIYRCSVRNRERRPFRWGRGAPIIWPWSAGSAEGGSRCSHSIRMRRPCSPGRASIL